MSMPPSIPPAAMPPQVPPHVRRREILASVGAVLAAAGVALAAWASHGVDEGARDAVQMAALIALLHGIAVAALAPLAIKRLARIALTLMLVGALLFTGSVVAGHTLGASTALAPWGGSALILAWLLHAWQRFPR